MSAATYTHDHLVRDLTARILDRLASQAPSRVPPVLDALDLRTMPRLAAQAGVAVAGADVHAIAREALDTIGQHLGHPVKENPPATAIQAGDLVLLALGKDGVDANPKGAEARLANQLKALDRSGAIAAVALDGFDAWSAPARAKISALLARPHPRLFVAIGRTPGVEPCAWVQRCVAVDVEHHEPVPCRKRALAM